MNDKKTPSFQSDTAECEIHIVDARKVEAVRKSMRAKSTMVELAQTFKVLGDPTRIKIIFALSQEELCVCDLASLLEISQSAVSHQLRTLRNMHIVKYRKAGKIAYYSLDDDHIRSLFNDGLRHIEEEI